MDAATLKALQIAHARSTLALRLEALAGAESAKRAGDGKAVRSWEAQVRKLDKLIREYGLSRYGEGFETPEDLRASVAQVLSSEKLRD